MTEKRANAKQGALLRQWTQVCGGTETTARIVLGVSHATWNRYVHLQRVLPVYIQRSIEVHLMFHQRDAEAFVSLVHQRCKVEEKKKHRSAAP